MDFGGLAVMVGICFLLIVALIAVIAFLVWLGMALYWVWHVFIKQ